MRRWLFAAFVLWHAAAVFATSIPTAGQGLNRKNWTEPTVQAEFRTWGEFLGLDPEALQDLIFNAAVGVQSVRDGIMLPFADYLEFANCRQSWKMFVAAHRFPTRLAIEGRPAEGEWETVYLERDPEHAWRIERFETERVRASVFAWGWPSASKRWKQACRGFARDLFAERADLAQVRCHFLKRRSPSPAELADGSADQGNWVLLQSVSRDEIQAGSEAPAP